MILISDSGATKADWICLDKEYNQLFITKTLGLNPEVLTQQDIIQRLEANEELSKIKHKVEAVYIYSAGCGTNRMVSFLKKSLRTFFSNKETKINIKEDTYAATYASIDINNMNQPAVICILGTGSNCSFWDGRELYQKVDSLGYVLMDDASGNYFGKKLIRAYYYNQMPKILADKFEQTYDLKPDTIKEHIYKEQNPNKYLADFARFLIENKDNEFFQKIIKQGFDKYINNYILQYPQAKQVPVHFVGSIAYFLKEELKQILENYGITLGNVNKKPIFGLMEYYKSKKQS